MFEAGGQCNKFEIWTVRVADLTSIFLSTQTQHTNLENAAFLLGL